MAEPARFLSSGCHWLTRQLEQTIVEVVAGGDALHGATMRALVLAGSMARGESGWLLGDGGAVLLGDAELFCFLQDDAPWPAPAEQRAWHERVAMRLRREGMHAEVSITPARVRYLRTLPPHVFGYELRHTGRVLWGDRLILEEVPVWPVAQLPREDAWRLLANRLTELLPSALEPEPPRTPRQIYPWVKLYLDIATSYLIFAGRYAPSYRERARRFLACAAEPEGRHPSFVNAACAAQVDACTAWKLNPDGRLTALFPGNFRARALACARQLWEWELQQLTGTAPGVEAGALWRQWQRRQSLTQQLRGWASAVRHDGLPAPRLWAHWLRLACHASPRHCVYEAGFHLLWHRNAPGRIVQTAALLPLPPLDPPPSAAAAAEAVLANYHRLVATTRA